MNRWLQDMPVTARVVSIFGLIILLTGLMTGLVGHHARTLEDISGDLHSRQYVAIHALADMQTIAEQLYATKGHSLLSSGSEDREAADREVAEIAARYAQLESTLLSHTPEGALRRAYDPVAGAWQGMHRNYATLAAAAEGKISRAEALELYHGADEDLIRAFRQQALALEALQLEELDKSGLLVTGALIRMQRAVYFTQFALAVLVLAGCFAVIRNISRPMQAVTRLMSEMSAGRLDIAIPVQARRDEIGRMTEALDVLRRNSLEARRLAQEKQKRTETLESLLAAFDTAVSDVLGTLAGAATELECTAREMGDAARDTGRQAQAAENAARGTSARVESVAAATEEINASLGEVSRQVVRATHITEEAVRQAHDTDHIVKGMEESARKIGDIVGVITEIAAQTNLLALNAAIEAARAGDAGRGFAVVATEVKTLAGQTAAATEAISAQIGGVQESVRAAADALRGILGTIASIDVSTSTIAAAVDEQNAATAEIAQTVAQVALGAQSAAENIIQASAATLRTDSAAAQVLSAARELSRESEMLKNRVEKFFGDLRRA